MNRPITLTTNPTKQIESRDAKNKNMTIETTDVGIEKRDSEIIMATM